MLVEDPERDELDLDDGGDNTHPCSSRENKNVSIITEKGRTIMQTLIS